MKIYHGVSTARRQLKNGAPVCAIAKLRFGYWSAIRITGVRSRQGEIQVRGALGLRWFPISNANPCFCNDLLPLQTMIKKDQISVLR